eukprot:scaffold1726_cov260-Pinguiococcus_pyrenoidosus.AAC.26
MGKHLLSNTTRRTQTSRVVKLGVEQKSGRSGSTQRCCGSWNLCGRSRDHREVQAGNTALLRLGRKHRITGAVDVQPSGRRGVHPSTSQCNFHYALNSTPAYHFSESFGDPPCFTASHACAASLSCFFLRFVVRCSEYRAVSK